MARDDITRGVFQCEFSRGFLKKIEGNEKTLFLEVSKNAIRGKAIVYPENTGNAYLSDIHYDIGDITKIEKMIFQGLVTFVIYVRTNTLYGREKYQLRFPGMKDIDRASSMLRNLLEANQGGNAATRPVNAPAPAQKAAAPSQPEPVRVSPAVTPPVQSPVHASVQTPVHASVQTPVHASVQTPVHASVQTPVHASVQTPMHASVQTPMQASAQTPMQASAQTPVQTSVYTVQSPRTAAPVQEKPAEPTLEERRKQYEKLEAIYQTGMISEKEYKTSKAEYISSESGLDEFYNKLKVNLQYSEIGFLSEKEFEDFKNEVVDEASRFTNVANNTYKQNLRKLLLLNLCELLSNDEYGRICDNIVSAVQYVSDDPEDLIVQKIERWPILKECEILSPAQYDQFLKIVAEDTKIKMGESIPILEHKLMRLTTLSKTFIFPPEEFAKKKREFIADMTEVDYSSDVKLRGQIERLMALRRCEWMDESEYQAKKSEVLRNIENNNDAVKKMQLFRILVEITYITQADYDTFKKRVIDDVFSNYGDISELRERAQTLMGLKEADIVTEEEFNDFKKKLLAL